MNGPYPTPGAPHQWAEHNTPMMAHVSGELTSNVSGAPIGAFKTGGKLRDVWISVEGSGKDDANPLSLMADVKINGVTCLSTQPAIAHVSGEDSMNKTTIGDAGFGITKAVLDADVNEVSPGDVATYDMAVTRTSPTSEMKNFVIVLEFQPG